MEGETKGNLEAGGEPGTDDTEQGRLELEVGMSLSVTVEVEAVSEEDVVVSASS